jgi:antitoxin ParD1/3/4
MNVSLTGEQQSFIERKVESGRYRSAAEVVREALRLLMEREADDLRREQIWREEVRRKIDEGFAQTEAGLHRDGEAVLEEQRRRLAARRKGRA